MPMPIRLVCACCLESVETSVGDGGRPPGFCPACGTSIDRSGTLPESCSDETAEVTLGRDSWSPFDAPTPQVEARPPLGRIGRFVLGDWIGGGGYGDVYRAFDPRLERDVALKVLKPTKLDAKATERFLREARSAAKLDHPNIVPLHDAGQDDNRLWIAYRLVRGRTLSQIRDARTLTLRQAIALIRDLALALDLAHRRGIFHRDLKPANVIVDDEGRPHLTDFGLARRLDLDSELTGEGTVLGTPAYMSPEQAAGRANLADGRSDIYSLGVILYELICGRRPTDTPSKTPPLQAGPKRSPPPPHSVDRAIPSRLDKVCMKALALNPDDRHPDGASFARALDECQISARPHRSLRKLAFGTLAASAIAMIGLTGLGRRDRWHGVETRNVASGGESNVITTVQSARDLGGPKPSEASTLVLKASPVMFVANHATKKVHTRLCHVLNRVMQPVEFASREEAEKAGFVEPCQLCNPW